MAQSAGAIDGPSLTSFVDGYMQHAMASGQTVGATVAVVRDGRLLMAKGYGDADLARGLTVSGATTQFRIGSISKVLVWIAVMQQVEAGRLDLEVDVNRYLPDFQLPTDFTAPITLRHLMTHTAGFEDNYVRLFVTGPRQVGNLRDTLQATMPRRVRLPGSLAAYSNYGAALAAHLVSVVSGMSWDDYVETQILRPLGMRDSTTRQPVPPHMEASRAKGYIATAAGSEEQGFTYIPLAPAGAASATAADMAKLMAELLNPAGSRVLSAASKARLLNNAYVLNPLGNNLSLGLYEMTLGGARALGHEGNTLLFHSRMVLWPAQKMGLFVSANSMESLMVPQELYAALSAYLGLSAKPAALSEVTQAQAHTGFYVTARRNVSNFTKFLGVFDSAHVAFDRNSLTLQVSDMTGTRRYRQLDEEVFHQVDGNGRIYFRPSPDGKQTLYFADRPAMGYTQATWPETLPFNLLLGLVWLVLAAGVLLVWPVSSLTHRRQPSAPGQRWLTILCAAACLAVVVFFTQVAAVADNAYQMMLQGLAQLPPLLWWPLAFAVLVFLQLLYGVRVWVEGFWWTSRRIHFTVLLLVQCALVWWFWYWNLLPEILLGYLK
jgi:CubicO group peptidase (beta-lactamase class C family)